MSQLILRTNMSSLVEMVGQPVACESKQRVSETAASEVDANAKRIQDEKDRVYAFIEYLHSNSKWYNICFNILLAIETILILVTGGISSLSAAGYLESTQLSIKTCISGVLQNSGSVDSSSAMIIECMKPSRTSAITCAILLAAIGSLRIFSAKTDMRLKSYNLMRHASVADGLLTRFNRLGTEESDDSLSVLIRESDALRKEIGDFITIKEMKKVFQNASNYVDSKVSSLRAELDTLKEELIAAVRSVPLNEIAVEVANAAPAAPSAARQVGRIMDLISRSHRD